MYLNFALKPELILTIFAAQMIQTRQPSLTRTSRSDFLSVVKQNSPVDQPPVLQDVRNLRKQIKTCQLHCLNSVFCSLEF